MRKTLIGSILLLVIALGALGLRLWRLEERPMHGDEANQAVRAGGLIEHGSYDYDPFDHHGPTLYYLSLPYAWLTVGHNFEKTSEFTFRLVPALFGVGLILLLFLVRDGLGRGPVLVSALLTAISPAMTYYSRFYIQEMLLVFFTFGAIAAGWRFSRKPSAGWALLFGGFVGLAYTTKETWILAFAAAGVSLLVLAESRRQLRAVDLRHALAAPAATAIVAVVFYSSFFTNWRGVIDSVLAYQNYIARGSGVSQHLHPWYYYLQILAGYRHGAGPFWSEGLILGLFVIGVVVSWRRYRQGNPGAVLPWFLAVYTVALTVLYALVRHKTPWCLLSFLHGMILVAGIGAAALLESAKDWRLKLLVGCLLAALAVQLGQQAWRASFRFAADPRNPYVYAHSSPDVLNLVRRVEQMAALHPEHRNMLVAVVATPANTWPLPWYFRTFHQVGYWTRPEDLPTGTDPAIVIAENTEENPMDAAIASRLGAGWQSEIYGLRPQILLGVHIKQPLWDQFIATRSAVKKPE